MRTLVIALAAGVLTSGCVIYESGGCPSCDWDWSDDWSDDDCTDTAAADTGDEAPAYVLSMAPRDAEQGDTFLARITAEGEFDMSTVLDVSIGGPVEVLYVSVEAGETVTMLRVPDDAPTGAFEVIVDLVDGTAVSIEGGLTIHPAGSGQSAEDGGC